jgi:hypothetical protein
VVFLEVMASHVVETPVVTLLIEIIDHFTLRHTTGEEGVHHYQWDDKYQ